MKAYRINHFKFAPVIGFGYWKDEYNFSKHSLNGYAHNIILPFLRIQIGEIWA